MVSLVTQYIEQNVANNDEIMSISIDLLSSLCEVTVLSPETVKLLSLHVILPLVNRILTASKSHASHLPLVYRLLSVTVNHLTSSVIVSEVVPLWIQFTLLLGTHSLTYSLTHLLTHSLTHYSLTHSYS